MEQKLVKKKSGVSNSIDCNADELKFIILHNDEVNTFDHVIDSLIQVCRHDSIQAEQCAFITHHKGKCDVMSGSFSELSPIRHALVERGLQVTID